MELISTALLSCSESFKALELTGAQVLPLGNSVAPEGNRAVCWSPSAPGRPAAFLQAAPPPPVVLVASVLLVLLTLLGRPLLVSADDFWGELPEAPTYPRCRDCPENLCFIRFTRLPRHFQHSK